MTLLPVNEYLTAAAIRAAGAVLVEVTQQGPRCVMLFDDTGSKASDLLSLHRSGELEVRSRDMADSVQAMKNEIFAARRN